METEAMDRRKALSLIGGLGAVVGAGSAGILRGGDAPVKTAKARLPWAYRVLDADAVGQRAAGTRAPSYRTSSPRG